MRNLQDLSIDNELESTVKKLIPLSLVAGVTLAAVMPFAAVSQDNPFAIKGPAYPPELPIVFGAFPTSTTLRSASIIFGISIPGKPPGSGWPER